MSKMRYVGSCLKKIGPPIKFKYYWWSIVKKYREGNGEIAFQEGNIEKLLKFKIYKRLVS